MMKEYTIDELITDLMKKCGLGDVVFPIEPVSGGLIHARVQYSKSAWGMC